MPESVNNPFRNRRHLRLKWLADAPSSEYIRIGRKSLHFPLLSGAVCISCRVHQCRFGQTYLIEILPNFIRSGEADMELCLETKDGISTIFHLEMVLGQKYYTKY